MSHLIILTDYKSDICKDFTEPLVLNTEDNNVEWVVGFQSLQTFYSIPNVDENCNKFYYDKNKVITIPIGNYEVEDIERYLNQELGLHNDILQHKGKIVDNDKSDKTTHHYLTLYGNNNTLKCEIISSYEIDFSQPNNIGKVLGFDKKKLEPNKIHISDLSINIQSVNAILVDCSIATGAYKNGELVHTIHEFFPSVDPGYRIIEQPSSIIYLPINTHYITNIQVKLTDQDGNLINFQNEKITVVLHIKKLKYNGY